MSFIRMGICQIKAGAFQEFKEVYETQVIHFVKKESGNLLACFFQDHQNQNRVLVITGWNTQQDADEHEKSGKAMTMVNKIKHFLAEPPLLETFEGYGI